MAPLEERLSRAATLPSPTDTTPLNLWLSLERSIGASGEAGVMGLLGCRTNLQEQVRGRMFIWPIADALRLAGQPARTQYSPPHLA